MNLKIDSWANWFSPNLREFSKSLTYESHSLTKINKIDNYNDQKVQTDEDISSKKSKNRYALNH